MDILEYIIGFVLVCCILYAFNIDAYYRIAALVVCVAIFMIVHAITFIMGSTLANAISRKSDSGVRPTEEDVKLAAIRKEALASSGA